MIPKRRVGVEPYIALRQSKYLHYVVDQDHRATKRNVRSLLGFVLVAPRTRR